MKRLAATAAALLVLAGCDSLTVRTVGGPTFLYKIGDLDYAGGGREMRVVVIDNSPAAEREALQKATVAGLQTGVGSGTRLSLAPQNFNREFKIVAMFAPAASISGSALCREPLQPPTFAARDATSETHVLAVFCREKDVLTEIDGYAPGVKVPGDGRFNALLSAVGQKLFPSRDLELGDIDRE